MDIEALEKNVLGNYFITKKYSSFQRQMRNYGFDRWSEMPIRKSDSKSGRKSTVIFFKHEYFKRGRDDLLVNIKKKKKETKSSKKRSSDADEGPTLKARLVSMEATQSELRLAIEQLKETSATQKTQISRLQRFDAGKDETIQAMHFRITSLESRLNTMLGPPFHTQYVQPNPYLNQTQHPLTNPAFERMQGYHPGPEVVGLNPYLPVPAIQKQSSTFNTGVSLPGPSAAKHDESPHLKPHPDMKQGRPFSESGGGTQETEDEPGSISRQLTDLSTLSNQSNQSWLKGPSFPDTV